MNDGELMSVVLSADLKSSEDKTTQEIKPNDYGEAGHWHFDLAPPPPPKATPKAAPQAPCPPPTASERWPVRLPVEGGQAKVLFQSNKVTDSHIVYVQGWHAILYVKADAEHSVFITPSPPLPPPPLTPST